MIGLEFRSVSLAKQITNGGVDDGTTLSPGVPLICTHVAHLVPVLALVTAVNVADVANGWH